jgi:small-conductance mechanosensitive channel
VILRRFPILICLTIALLPFSVAAQSPEEINQKLSGMNVVLGTIEAALQREGLAADQLLEERQQAHEVAAEAQEIVNSVQPKIAELEARRDALKPAVPGDENATPVAPESEELVKERSQIEEELVLWDEFSKRASATATRATQLAARAVAVERERFTRLIFERNDTIAGPDLWRSLFNDMPIALAGIEQVFGDITERFVSRGALGLIPPLLFLLAVSFVVLARLRHAVVDQIAGRAGHDKPTELGKAIVACLVALFVMMAPLLGLLLARWSADVLGLASPSLIKILDRAGFAILVISTSIGFSRAILAPNRPAWRLIAASESDVHSMGVHVRAVAAVVAAGVFLGAIGDVANVPQSIIVFVGSLLTLLFSLLLWRALRSYRAILEGGETAPSAGRHKYQSILRFIAMAGLLAALAIAAAALFGFVPLAWFLSKQVVWFCFVFASYALIDNLIDAAGDVVSSDDKAPAGRIARLTGMGRATIAQSSIIGFGIVKMLLVVITLILVAAPWGFKSDSVVEEAKSLMTGFQVGGLNISLTTIAAGLILFLIGMFFTRSFRTWLGERYLPTTSIDPGLKNSITTTAGYLGFILSVVVAFGFVGIDLSQLGLVAGALSVGIGFGLQSIVNNFVSGLILLAERPIKAGDWIIVGGEEGTVKKINVRATELETFDRASVVIPNSDLISGTVRNWVLGGTMGRVSLAIGVGYGSDADQVREVLLACAEDHELVLAYPEPAVFFIDFGDSALIFRLDAYLADIGKGFGVRSDLRFEILRRFREAGIEIPFPQRDLHIRTSDELTGLIDRAATSSS